MTYLLVFPWFWLSLLGYALRTVGSVIQWLGAFSLTVAQDLHDYVEHK
jgi:hypothetical protein